MAADWDTLRAKFGARSSGLDDTRRYDTARQVERAIIHLVVLYSRQGYTAAQARELARTVCERALDRAR